MYWIKKEAKIKYNENDELINKLGKIRGIKPQELDSFLNPSKETHDPFMLNNIAKSADKTVEAIKNNKKIGISYDIDIDGIAGGAIVYNYLSNFTDNIQNIYAERSSGHGIEYQIDQITTDIDLLIIIDSSTNSPEACKQIEDKGIDIIILDHHEKYLDNPYATIVNPQMDDYPNKELSGAGVAYKFIQVLDKKLKKKFSNEYIDLAGIGLHGDIMCMKNLENRNIVYEALNNIKNKGIKTILLNNNIKINSINSNTIAFTISPFINGIARLDKIKYAIDLLTETNEFKCFDIFDEIKNFIDEKDVLENELLEELITQAENQKNDKVITTIHYDKSKKGLNGLVANKLASMYFKPVMVTIDSNGYIGGSFRGFNGFNLKDILEELKKENIIKFVAGHPPAGGVGFFKDKQDKMKNKINEKLKDIDFTPEIYYDLELKPEEIDIKTIEIIDAFNYITGKNFDPVKIVIKDLFLTERKLMGKKNNTIKFSCDDEIDLIKFRTSPNWKEEANALTKVDVIGVPNINEFRGKKNCQIFLDDIKIIE